MTSQNDDPISAQSRFLTRHSWLLVAASLSFFSGCGGCETDLVDVAPLIAVDACTENTFTNNEGEDLGGASGCAIAYGDQDISVRHSREVRISNPSGLDLTIADIAFDKNSDPSFRVDRFPDKVGPGITSVALISWRPLLESDVTGTLVIMSDAKNTRPADSTSEDVGPWPLEIPITGSGVDNGVPDIQITPAECDYGRVAKDSVAQCILTVENLGNRPLILESVLFDADALTVPNDSTSEPFGFFGRAPGENDQIPAAGEEGSSVTISVRFSPDALGGYYGSLRLMTNDPDETEVEIPLSGIGVNPPNCDVAIKSVNGIEGATSVEPLDDVVLTANASSPSVAGGTIESVLWEFIERPSGSNVTFTQPTGTETQFTFAGGVLGLDVAGRYRIRATVTDDLGTQSVNECEVTFEAIPTDTILTQLTWDTAEGDMDLHFIKAEDDGRYCSTAGVDLGASDLTQDCTGADNAGVCYYGNCKATNSTRRPNWDGDSNTRDGDPSLDLDDLTGYGPENINIDLAVPGSYLVAVDHFSYSGPGSVGNTVRIYLYGQLQAEFWRDLTDSDWWEVAVIHWPGIDNGVPCIEDLGTPAIECPDFQ